MTGPSVHLRSIPTACVAGPMINTIQPAEIRDYLQAIAGDDPASGLIDIRYFTRPGKMAIRFVPSWKIETAVRLIASLAKRTDTYTGVVLRTQRRGTRQAVAHSHLLFVEIDSPDARQRLERLPQPPTMVIASGTCGHVHAYWRLRWGVDADTLEAANRRLAHHLDGDLASIDAARILRPAGTLNHKHAPAAPVQLMALKPERTYELDELIGPLVSMPSKPRSSMAPRRTDPGGIDHQLLAIPTHQYVSQLADLEASRAGKVRCPFHKDHNPSMHLYTDGTWACFGCRRGGTIYDFAAHLWSSQTKGRAFIELRKRLADEFGILSRIG
jgi:ribosomal protein L19